MITQKRLKELLFYNPCTGEFIWKARNSKTKVAVGKRAGSVDPNGYRIIFLDNHCYRSCRLAWLYCYGVWPVVIDHINRNGANDSIWNLSNGTQKDNMQNSRMYVGDPNSRSRTAYAKTWRRQIFRPL